MDQGSQFLSGAWLEELTRADVAISVDGRGRAFGNIFTERLWRSVKYEDVYVKDYRAMDEARRGLAGYFGFYNAARLHEALGYPTLPEVHFGSGSRCNNATGVNKKETEAITKTTLLHNTTLKNLEFGLDDREYLRHRQVVRFLLRWLANVQVASPQSPALWRTSSGYSKCARMQDIQKR
ncbi:MAG: integrase core domain-containing protein [Phycisphaerales bacterium]